MSVAASKRAGNAVSPVDEARAILAEARAETERMRRAMSAFARVLTGETEHFSTQGGDRNAPAEYQGRAKKWRTDAPTIPGAVRVGRWVTVSRAAYADWVESKASAPSPAPVAVVAAWNPLDTFASLRAVGGKK